MRYEDPTIRDGIDTNAMGNGPAAWQIVIGYGQVPQTFLKFKLLNKIKNGMPLSFWLEVGFTDYHRQDNRELQGTAAAN